MELNPSLWAKLTPRIAREGTKLNVLCFAVRNDTNHLDFFTLVGSLSDGFNTSDLLAPVALCLLVNSNFYASVTLIHITY